jgi:hypothetical protein
MGMGVGAAMTGLRPIVEGMNMGFLLLAFNQISNNCGMLHYTSGGQYKVPVVIRGPGGVGRQLGAEHSQRLESYFQSIPGVQLVAVSTVANAKALLKSVSACGFWGPGSAAAARRGAPRRRSPARQPGAPAARGGLPGSRPPRTNPRPPPLDCRPSAATTPSSSSSTCCCTT